MSLCGLFCVIPFFSSRMNALPPFSVPIPPLFLARCRQTSPVSYSRTSVSPEKAGPRPSKELSFFLRCGTANRNPLFLEKSVDSDPFKADPAFPPTTLLEEISSPIAKMEVYRSDRPSTEKAFPLLFRTKTLPRCADDSSFPGRVKEILLFTEKREVPPEVKMISVHPPFSMLSAAFSPRK